MSRLHQGVVRFYDWFLYFEYDDVTMGTIAKDCHISYIYSTLCVEIKFLLVEMTSMTALFYSGVLVSHDSVTVSHFIIYTCAISTVTFQNVFPMNARRLQVSAAHGADNEAGKESK